MEREFGKEALEIMTLICRDYTGPRLPIEREIKAIADYFIWGSGIVHFGCPSDNQRVLPCSSYYSCHQCWKGAIKKYHQSKIYKRDREIYEVM
jgi:hypothetical protein